MCVVCLGLFALHLDFIGRLYIVVVIHGHFLSLQKQAYSNILKMLPPKNENFQIKNLDIFSYFCSKHRLWVLVRTASARRF